MIADRLNGTLTLDATYTRGARFIFVHPFVESLLFSIFVCMIKGIDWIKKIRIRWVVLVVCLAFVWTVMALPVWGEWYARRIYPFFSIVLSRVSSFFPFSVGDCFIYGSIAGLVVYLIYAIVKRRSWKKTAGRMAE